MSILKVIKIQHSFCNENILIMVLLKDSKIGGIYQKINNARQIASLPKTIDIKLQNTIKNQGKRKR